MKYVYFKSELGNFGDDLNPWLWPQLFGKQVHIADANFFGVGSILHAENSHLKRLSNERKIVFGTGIRPSNLYKNLSLDETWDVRFLRGPYSARYLDNRYKYISDAAYAVRQLESFSEILNTPKKYEVSLMPYFHSMNYFNWKKISNHLGYNFISPHSENGVKNTLKEIAASKYLITEAMHGAILADALRTPWKRFVLTTPYTEGGRISDFKWNDWLNSIDICKTEVAYVPLYQNTRLHNPIKRLTGNMVSAKFLIKSKVIDNLIKSLSDTSGCLLSSDKLLKNIDSKFHEEIQEFI